jgi:PAS domain S-box-containing protein
MPGGRGGPTPMILNVHGDLGLRGALSRTLEAAGFRVREADGIAAAAGADLVVLDGRRAADCVRLKADPATSAIPVLVIASDLTGLTAAADMVLSAPAEPEELTAAARTLIELGRARAAKAAPAPADDRRLTAFYDDAPVGLCETDPDGRFLRVNPRFCKMTGYAAAELLGRGVGDVTHLDDLPADLDLARRLNDGEVPSYTIEKRYLQKDGHPVWVTETC